MKKSDSKLYNLLTIDKPDGIYKLRRNDKNLNLLTQFSKAAKICNSNETNENKYNFNTLTIHRFKKSIIDGYGEVFLYIVKNHMAIGYLNYDKFTIKPIDFNHYRDMVTEMYPDQNIHVRNLCLRQIFVIPSHRNTGQAKELLKTLEHLEQVKENHIYFGESPNPKSLKLYKDLGITNGEFIDNHTIFKGRIKEILQVH